MNRYFGAIPRLLVILILFILCSCASEHGVHRWGQDVTIRPGWDHIYRSAVRSLTAPEMWVPAAGALVFQIDDWDQEVSNWAAERNPVFGSEENADMWSNHLRLTSEITYVVTALATPGGETIGEWTSEKLKGFSVGAGAYLLNDGTTGLLKTTVKRTRPDGADTKSFPSGHATRTSLFSTLSSKNISWFNVQPTVKTSARVMLGVLSLGTAWARVEAGKHYPSDVLAGMAIGNFIGSFINDAFLGPEGTGGVSILIVPSGRGILIGANMQF